MKSFGKKFHAVTPAIFCVLLITALYLLSLFPTGAFAEGVIDGSVKLNGQDIQGDYISDDGSIQWNRSTATLTLNGAKLTSQVAVYFTDVDGDEYGDGKLTVRLIGDNSLITDEFGFISNGDMDITAEAGASLTVKSSGERVAAFWVKKQLTIDGGRYDIVSDGVALYSYHDLIIKGGADVTAKAEHEVAIFSYEKNIVVQDGSHVTAEAVGMSREYTDSSGDYYSSHTTSGFYAMNGNVTITGSGTVADIKASAAAVSAENNAIISDGAKVTGESEGALIYANSGSISIESGATVNGSSTANSAVFAGSGNITITGSGTTVDVTAYYCALQAGGDIKIDDEAAVTGVSSADSAVYLPSGNITISGGASLTVPSTVYYGIYARSGNVTVNSGASFTVQYAPYNAIYVESGEVKIDGADTTVKLTAYICAIQASGHVSITGGANVTGSSESNSAVFTSGGNVTIDSGASFTVTSAVYDAIYAQSGSVIIDGGGTVANLTSVDSTVCGTAGVTVSGGAELTVNSSGNSAVYSASGVVNITGNGTVASLTAKSGMLNGTFGVTVSDGAVVTGSAGSTAIYSAEGNALIESGAKVTVTDSDTAVYLAKGTVTFTGKDTDADLTAKRTAVNNINKVSISDGANVKITTNGTAAIFSLTDVDISDATVTLFAENGNAINSKGNLTITGKDATVVSHSSHPIFGSTVTIKGAAVLPSSTGEAIGADGNITISDGARITAAVTGSGLRSAIVSSTGDIILDGETTQVDITSTQRSCITAINGKVSINAHVKATTVEGVSAILACEVSKTNETEPSPRIVIGENYGESKSIIVTTAWKPTDSGEYSADTVFVPVGTELNGDDRLEGEYTPTNAAEILKIDFVPGDLNRDGGVTDNDAEYLLYHLQHPTAYTVNQDCDFNKDSRVDEKDAEYLMYDAAFCGKYPTAENKGKITCTVSNPEIKIGDTFTVTVSASGFAPIRSGGVALEFDRSVLEYVDSEWLINSDVMGFDTSNIQGVFMYFPLKAQSIDGDILRVTLRARADAPKAGEFTVIAKDCFINENGENTSSGDFGSALVNVSCAEHKYGKLVDGIPAKCGVDGKKAYYECAVCRKLFDERKIETTEKELVIPALSHIAEDGWHSDADFHWKECVRPDCQAVLDETKAAHSFDWVVDRPATEEQAGLQHEECSVCGYKRSIDTEIPCLKPDTPDNPDTPDVPVTPDTPDNPDTPDVPVTPVAPAKFPDVPKNAWYTESVDYVSSYSIMKGKTQKDGSIAFEPGGNLTRAEFAQILANLAGIDTTSPEAKNQTTRFSDVAANKWFTAAVKWANDNGIVLGLTETEFGPNKNIERQQVCTMLARFIEQYMHTAFNPTVEKRAFTDGDEIQTYAKEAVEKCQTAGIINGMTDGRFAPRDNATRAEAAKIMMMFHESYIKNKMP